MQVLPAQDTPPKAIYVLTARRQERRVCFLCGRPYQVFHGEVRSNEVLIAALIKQLRYSLPHDIFVRLILSGDCNASTASQGQTSESATQTTSTRARPEHRCRHVPDLQALVRYGYTFEKLCKLSSAGRTQRPVSRARDRTQRHVLQRREA